MTDPIVTNLFNPGEYFIYIMEGLLAIGVIMVAKIWIRVILKTPLKKTFSTCDRTGPDTD